MKFFLVISIIALCWVPTNLSGNIDLSNFPFPAKLFQSKTETFKTKSNSSITKRKMDHFGFQNRRNLLRNELEYDGDLSKSFGRNAG